MNSYGKHLYAMERQLSLFLSTREIFGKPVKRRLFAKWHHRYLRERKSDIKRHGTQCRKSNAENFGMRVYTYHIPHGYDLFVAYTSRPKCFHSKPLPFNHAVAMAQIYLFRRILDGLDEIRGT